jgi:hypothetical protein
LAWNVKTPKGEAKGVVRGDRIGVMSGIILDPTEQKLLLGWIGNWKRSAAAKSRLMQMRAEIRQVEWDGLQASEDRIRRMANEGSVSEEVLQEELAAISSIRANFEDRVQQRTAVIDGYLMHQEDEEKVH